MMQINENKSFSGVFRLFYIAFLTAFFALNIPYLQAQEDTRNNRETKTETETFSSDDDEQDSESTEGVDEPQGTGYDPDVVKGAPIFPEPMVFDLVRPLGARKGEFEVNNLAVLPIKRRNYNVEWAPEVEFAFADGYALELELPMYNGHIEAYKLALQGTFSFNKKATFIHGWQWIGEYVLEGRILENNFLYLMGYDLGGGKSIFNILGPRHNYFEPSNEFSHISEWTFLWNLSLNQKIHHRLTVSLENNYSYHIGIGHELRVIPQIHWNISEFYNFQIGAGYQWMMEARSPVLATRFIREF